MDGKLSSEDYQRMKSNINKRIDGLNTKLESLNPQNTSIGQKLEHAFNVIRNMPEILSSGRVEHKIQLLGSMFPEKIQFDGEKYRTNYSSFGLMAVKNRPVTQELIFHSDRGIQYACNEFRTLVDTFSLVKRSMSRKGNCWDNAVAESFFKNLKMEWVYQRKYRSRMQAALSVFEYIESWYNTDRIHSALEMSIKEFNAINNNHKL